MKNENPWIILQNFGSDTNTALLVGAPILLGVIAVALISIVIVRRRRAERRDLTETIKEESKLIRAQEIAEASSNLPLAISVAPEAKKVAPPKLTWAERLRSGLAKTRTSLSTNLGALFGGSGVALDEGVLEKVYETLYRADLGATTVTKLTDHVRKALARSEPVTWESVKTALGAKISEILAGVERSDVAASLPTTGPRVILVVGVNGVGKTTTIGKLAAYFQSKNQKVLLCAADTFRAAAIEQLAAWGDRIGVDVIKQQPGSDPSAVAFDGVKAAIARGIDVLMIDTAGRLHSKTELMAELSKIKRVVGKDLPGAPHEVWLVLDATTGQNAIAQAKAFKEVVDVTGLVITKLDGTAKGGVVVAIADQFAIPIRFIGVGESAEDLREFQAREFADSLF